MFLPISLFCLLLKCLSLPPTPFPCHTHWHLASHSLGLLQCHFHPAPSWFPNLDLGSSPQLFHWPCHPLNHTQASWDCAQLPPKKVAPNPCVVNRTGDPNSLGTLGGHHQAFTHVCPTDQQALGRSLVLRLRRCGVKARSPHEPSLVLP